LLEFGSPLSRKTLVTRLRAVVDEILNSEFDCHRGRRRGVIDLPKRRPPGTAGDQLRTAPPSRSISAAQSNAFGGARRRDDAFQLADHFRYSARFYAPERLGGILT